METKIINSEISNSKITKFDDIIIYNGKEYRSFSRYNRYNSKRKTKKIIYKCINIRKDENFRRNTNQPVFCNGTIEYIVPGQNVKSGYFIKKLHSLSCHELDYKNVNEKAQKNVRQKSDKENFINSCYDVMNKSTIYDRRLFKEE